MRCVRQGDLKELADSLDQDRVAASHLHQGLAKCKAALARWPPAVLKHLEALKDQPLDPSLLEVWPLASGVEAMRGLEL